MVPGAFFKITFKRIQVQASIASIHKHQPCLSVIEQNTEPFPAHWEFPCSPGATERHFSYREQQINIALLLTFLKSPFSPQTGGAPPSCRTGAAQPLCPSPASSGRLSASPGLSGTPPSYSAASASPPPAPFAASGPPPPAVVGRCIDRFIEMVQFKDKISYIVFIDITHL